MAKNKIGVGKQQPAGAARPLGQSASKVKKAKTPATPPAADPFGDDAAVPPTDEKTLATDHKPLDTEAAPPVDSLHSEVTQQPQRSIMEVQTQTIQLSRSTKATKSKWGIAYTGTGLRGAIRIPKTNFAGDPPDTVTITGSFSEGKPVVASMTKEERKAYLAGLPKLTLAEKIAKREKQLTAMKAKAEAEAAKATPELVGAGV